jgi:hypothetical protein
MNDYVAFDASTVKVFEAHRKQEREDRVAWGGVCVGSGKIVTRENARRCTTRR